MGQTLTHGVYLPDEGERNCYSGLAANWQILDNSVGTIAEHTSALSGKAPLVHTHTKADITDFPAYGNTAGTICEGNDSRLSDARTPVAHTHVTADVTDLLNSTHRWTTNQNLKNTAITDHQAVPSADTAIGWGFLSNDNKYWGGIKHGYFTTGISEVQITMSNWNASGSQGFWHLDFGATKDFSNVYFRPSANNTINLGDSTHQWNNLHAKNYYYNGVAWGLDKANEWTGINTFSSALYGELIRLKNTGLDLSNGNPALSSTFNHMIWWDDKNNTHYAKVQAWTNNNSTSIILTSLYKVDANTVNYTSLRTQCSASSKAFFPETNGDIELGTSTNKWKTLNGINPGALSLPNNASSQSLDVSAQGLNWDLTGATDNTYTPTFDGWLQLRCKDIAGDFLFAICGSVRQSVSGSGYISDLNAGLALTIPMEKGRQINMRCKASSKFNASIIPCFGNV